MEFFVYPISFLATGASSYGRQNLLGNGEDPMRRGRVGRRDGVLHIEGLRFAVVGDGTHGAERARRTGWSRGCSVGGAGPAHGAERGLLAGRTRGGAGAARRGAAGAAHMDAHKMWGRKSRLTSSGETGEWVVLRG